MNAVKAKQQQNMSALATFGICLAIAIVLLLLLASTPIALLIMIFPLLIAENLTGERGMFAPNGGSGSKKSWLFQVIVALGFLTEAFILAVILYGAQGIIWGWPDAKTMTIAHKISLSTSQASAVQNINKALLLLLSYSLIMYTYYTVIKRERFTSKKDMMFFFHNILPFIAYAFGFIYLIGCYFYLNDNPRQSHLDLKYSVSGMLYLTYNLFILGRTLYVQFRTLRSESTGMKLIYGFRMLLGFTYSGFLIYYAYLVYKA